MKVVLQMFWRICLLRQSPAHVPGHFPYSHEMRLSVQAGALTPSS